MYIYRLSFIKEEMMFKMASSVEEQRSGFQLMILCELGGGEGGGLWWGGGLERGGCQAARSVMLYIVSFY